MYTMRGKSGPVHAHLHAPKNHTSSKKPASISRSVPASKYPSLAAHNLLSEESSCRGDQPTASYSDRADQRAHLGRQLPRGEQNQLVGDAMLLHESVSS